MTHLLLPEGTMVVTRVELRTIGGEQQRPRGAAGRVVQAPTDATHAYRVAFPDGQQVMAKRTELAVLKHFQNAGFDTTGEVLEEYDLWDHVALRCVVGSRAYGLDRDGSDTDRRGVYLPPAELQWSLFGVPAQLESSETEECYWEIEKFLTLALKANPNVLEVLYTPLVEHSDATGDDILAHRDIFLSQLVYQTYSRYVMSQFKKLTTKLERDGEVKWKHAMHLIRLLQSGITILRDGFVPVEVDHQARQQLLAIRDGEIPWPEVDALRLQLQREIDAEFERSKLPERPNYGAANDLLLRARRRAL